MLDDVVKGFCTEIQLFPAASGAESTSTLHRHEPSGALWLRDVVALSFPALLLLWADVYTFQELEEYWQSCPVVVGRKGTRGTSSGWTVWQSNAASGAQGSGKKKWQSSGMQKRWWPSAGGPSGGQNDFWWSGGEQDWW